MRYLRTLVIRSTLLIFAAVGIVIGASSTMPAQNQNTTQKETKVTAHATGSFEVKLIPQTDDEILKGTTLGRMTIDKHFHGGLEGSSQGEMLTGGTQVKDSAGYVAMEQFTGTLNGRKGTFILQHSGTMNRGVPTLTITVVPDSGTGELVGLTGTFGIKITEGKHSYDFEYSLPEQH
jgi:hypothetical protein